MKYNILDFMDNNIEEKIRNLEEWNDERARVKPFIDMAVDFHNRARTESRWKHYDQAADFYKKAIEKYKEALAQKPKYYLPDLLDRIDHVIEEHVNNVFNLKTFGDKLKNKDTINEFVKFIDNLNYEEGQYIDPYDIASAYLSIANFYYETDEIDNAYEFYKKTLDINCNRSFVNREAYFNIGTIQIGQKRFKEALVSFVSVLSFDKNNKEAIAGIERCLAKLNITEYKDKFLSVTPNKAKKLIMELL